MHSFFFNISYPSFLNWGTAPQQTIEKKWNDLGMNPQWLIDYSDEVSFLVRTRLIYSILGFQHSTCNGLKLNEIKVLPLPRTNKHGLWIKKEGKWVSVARLQKTMEWKGRTQSLLSKANKAEGWCYLSDTGLTPIHPLHDKRLMNFPLYSSENQRMHPVARLSEQEMESLLIHAARFENQSFSRREIPKGAIQVVTYPNCLFKGTLLQNFGSQLKLHYGLRLIMPDGSLYSFGFGRSEHENVLNNQTRTPCATMNGQPKILDYMEFQKFENRLVTTVPLSENEAEKILQHLHFYRKNGLRFNLLKQNCARFTTHLLHIAGVSINIRISLFSIGLQYLPKANYLQRMFQQRERKQEKESWKWIAAVIPSIVKEPFFYLASIFVDLSKQIYHLILNLGLIYFGGRLADSIDFPHFQGSDQSSKAVENFDVLVPSIFDQNAAYIHHPSLLLRWQLHQTTTEIYRYSGQPKMNILPSESPEEQVYSKKKIEELKVVYAHCTE